MDETLLRLITACVDGELSASQRRRLERLLQSHPEAGQLLARLQADRAALQRLSGPQLDAGFTQRVLDSLPPRAVPARTRRTVAAAYAVARWWPVAAAATVVLAINLAAALLVYDLTRPRGRPAEVLAHHPATATEQAGQARPLDRPRPPADADVSEPTAKGPASFASADAQPQEPSAPAADEHDRGASYAAKAGPATAEGKPPTPADPVGPIPDDVPFADPTILTAPPGRSPGNFKTLDLRLPLIFDLQQLDSSQIGQRLIPDTVHHLDIACLDSWRTFEMVQAAGKACDIRLTVEGELSQRLARKIPTPCMVYLENVSPELVVRLLSALRADELKNESSQPGQGQIISLMLLPLDEAGRKRLAEALALPPAALSPPPRQERSPASLDPTRPLAEDTLRSLEQLAHKARPPSAVALIYVPQRARLPLSRELKQFHDSRIGLLPGHVHVVLYLRPSRG
jgi:hypothetical protein